MFNSLKNSLRDQELMHEAFNILSEMANAPEDEILDSIVVSDEENAELKKIIDKIPDTPIGNTEQITDEDLKKAADNVPDPTIEELLDDNMID